MGRGHEFARAPSSVTASMRSAAGFVRRDRVGAATGVGVVDCRYRARADGVYKARGISVVDRVRRVISMPRSRLNGKKVIIIGGGATVPRLARCTAGRGGASRSWSPCRARRPRAGSNRGRNGSSSTGVSWPMRKVATDCLASTPRGSDDGHGRVRALLLPGGDGRGRSEDRGNRARGSRRLRVHGEGIPRPDRALADLLGCRSTSAATSPRRAFMSKCRRVVAGHGQRQS